uniref:Ig-like domain-containing protein n=1 Tax=Parascaris equorum TaxID=6256 RepID=A0A914RUF5_PAREQ
MDREPKLNLTEQISLLKKQWRSVPVKLIAGNVVLKTQSLPPGFPVIEAHPVLKSVEQGRTAHVSCRVRGDPRPKVLWIRDLMPIDVRSNSRYSVSTLGNPGQYAEGKSGTAM